MNKLGSTSRTLHKKVSALDVQLKQLEIEKMELECAKLRGDLELITETIRHKKFLRRMAKVTTMLTGLSLIATVLVHFGVINKS